jgi:hypothetical protein
MNQPQKMRKTARLTAIQSRQMSIGFESIGLLGLTSSERLKAVGQLARLLMLAAGIAAKERDDER